MANIRLVRRRIKSAKNIAQITKAMELVAASKMKKAQVAALSGKLYAGKIYQMVMELSAKVDATQHPLLKRPIRQAGKRLVVLLSTNKGLCGGLNTNLFRFTLQQYTDIRLHEYVTLGRKGANFISRMGGTLLADFSTGLTFTASVPALGQLITKEFFTQRFDGIDLVYSEFISALKQFPVRKMILPLDLSATQMEVKQDREFVIEPSMKDVLHLLLPHYLENQIRDAVLQAEASEHSARMIAMRNATDNAFSLMEDLTLVYNKARQEKITYEISDIVTARLAVEG